MRVVNASPLIHLARVSLLEWLRGPGQDDEVLVPAVVLDEVLRGAGHDPTAGLVEAAARDWLTVVPTPILHPDINPARIDEEIAVLSIARLTPGSTVVLDDQAARRKPFVSRSPKTGTLRLLLEAKAGTQSRPSGCTLTSFETGAYALSDDVWREVLSWRESGTRVMEHRRVETGPRSSTSRSSWIGGAVIPAVPDSGPSDPAREVAGRPARGRRAVVGLNRYPSCPFVVPDPDGPPVPVP